MDEGMKAWWLIVTLIVGVGVLVFEIGFILGDSCATEDPGEKHSTLITFDNGAPNDTVGQVYVMDGGEWDLLDIYIEGNSSTTVQITWRGDYEVVTVFAVFDYDGYQSIFRYEVREKEHRTVVLI